jgi:hypothetical protein
MGRGGIGGAVAAADMENSDSTRCFVRDVKRIVIKVHIITCMPSFLLLSHANRMTPPPPPFRHVRCCFYSPPSPA